MTARDQLLRVRQVLLAGTVAAGLLGGVATALGILAGSAVLDALVGLPAGVRSMVMTAAVAGGVIAFALRVWRVATTRRLDQVALWVEERVPALRYALVTSLDPEGTRYAGELDRTAATIEFGSPAWAAVRRALLVPGLTLLAGLGLYLALPRGVVARVTAPRSSGPLGGHSAGADGLAGLRVEVNPPAYTRLPRQVLDDPASITAVTGSAIRIQGAAGAVPVTAAAESLRVRMEPGADRWTGSLTMPGHPAIVRLRQGSRERLLLLDPRPDSVPHVLLELPARDTVLREPTGNLPAVATLRDDFGLALAWWEVVISSGEGESFKFRTVQLGRASLGHAPEAERSLVLRLDSLGLEPGDLVHLRAVAQDGNTATGPGIAGSDTRTIRIARAGEYDSLSIEAMPPADPLKGVISQRMLIILTEALDKKKRTLARPVLLGESGRIARDQHALRRQVGDIIFSRLEDLGGDEHAGDEPRPDLTPDQLLAAADSATQAAGGEPLDFAGGESPVIAINRPLLEAYNAMWEAGRELSVGDTRRALPHMYAALAAIQRARLAERIYLRGQARAPIVDLAKVRLAGRREGIDPARRSPEPPADAEQAGRGARFERALEAIATQPASAIDSFMVLRADLLVSGSGAAEPLGAAIDALRQGKDATGFLIRAYRSLQESPASRGGLSRWGQVP